MSLLVKLQAYMTHKNIRRNVNSDLSIVTIFWSLVESIGVIKKMKEILLTEKEMIFLVLLYFRALLKVINPWWMFFTFLKLYKWYQIAQRITEN